MSRKTRYQFIKKKYPSYIIIFHEKERYITYDIDRQILEQFSKLNLTKELETKKINYIIFFNITIEKKYETKNNQYSYYEKLTNIRNIITKIINQ